MNIHEMRSEIRRQGLHIKLGISGTEVSNLSSEQASRLLAGELITDTITNTIEETKPMQTNNGNGDIAGALAALQNALFNPTALRQELLADISKHGEALSEKLDDKIQALIDQRLPRVVKIEIRNEKGVKAIEGIHHTLFPLITKILSCPEINLALVGPAGSGKSKVVQNAAKLLGVDFKPMSFNALTSKADILGFVDATGTYHASAFRTCFEHGGIFLADEFDASNPGIATILNAAIANRFTTFADGETLSAHEQFRCVAAMNTWGTGPSAQYVGRNRLDAATLDRFAFLEFDYDDTLESALMGVPVDYKPEKPEKGGLCDAIQWLLIVHKFRNVCRKLNLQTITSPRASLMGGTLCPHIGKFWLVKMLLAKGLDETQLKAVSREMKLDGPLETKADESDPLDTSF